MSQDQIIEKAIIFAAKAHNKQLRKGSDVPYITHPFTVGWMLRDAGANVDQIVAGLLHDVIEDTDITPEQLKAEFGDRVTQIVLTCSEDSKTLSWEERKVNMCNVLRATDEETKMVACADKLHNITCICRDRDYLGDDVWKKFQRGQDQQSWYYRKLRDTLTQEGKICGLNFIYNDFFTAVNNMFGSEKADAHPPALRPT